MLLLPLLLLLLLLLLPFPGLGLTDGSELILPSCCDDGPVGVAIMDRVAPWFANGTVDGGRRIVSMVFADRAPVPRSIGDAEWGKGNPAWGCIITSITMRLCGVPGMPFGPAAVPAHGGEGSPAADPVRGLPLCREPEYPGSSL